MAGMPLGWIPPEGRAPEVQRAHEDLLTAMPKFAIQGEHFDDGIEEVILTDYWKHPYVKQQIGFEFPGWFQNTGSCVGVDGGNCEFTLCVIEAIRLKQPEKIVVPLWLVPYGKSRQLLGMRGKGSGSLSSALAKALQTFGVGDAAMEGAPRFTVSATEVQYSGAVENEFSDGFNIPKKYLDAAAPHLVKTSAPISSADEAREAIKNYYPIMTGYRYYVGIGNAKIVDGEVIGEPVTFGGHSVAILGWKKHKTFGELFLYMNTHPRSVYPADPHGCIPRGGCWIKAEAMDKICKEEAMTISQYEGFPAAKDLDYVP